MLFIININSIIIKFINLLKELLMLFMIFIVMINFIKYFIVVVYYLLSSFLKINLIFTVIIINKDQMLIQVWKI